MVMFHRKERLPNKGIHRTRYHGPNVPGVDEEGGIRPDFGRGEFRDQDQQDDKRTAWAGYLPILRNYFNRFLGFARNDIYVSL